MRHRMLFGALLAIGLLFGAGQARAEAEAGPEGGAERHPAVQGAAPARPEEHHEAAPAPAAEEPHEVTPTPAAAPDEDADDDAEPAGSFHEFDIDGTGKDDPALKKEYD